MSEDSLTWTARYYRHSKIESRQFGSLLAAVEFLSAGLDSNLASPDAIIGPDGVEVYRFGDDDLGVWDLRDKLYADLEGTDSPS